MNLFFVLLFKILPLIGYSAIGYIAARFVGIPVSSIARITIYTITPAVVLLGVLRMENQPELLLLPLVVFALFSLLGLLLFFSLKNRTGERTRSIVSYGAVAGNTGYMGLPVALALLGDAALPIIVLAGFGGLIFESTFGIYFMARANFSVRDSVRKVLGLPHLYALILGLILFYSPIQTTMLESFLEPFKGAYVILGMMIIGAGMVGVAFSHFDKNLLSLLFINKFIVLPLLMFGLIWIDKTYFNIYETLIHQCLFLLSIVPMAANTVAYAAELKVDPEKVSIAVVLSTVISLFTIPLLMMLFI